MKDIAAQLREQVFLANYNSREQRLLRAAAMAILVGKHCIRGSLLFLPIYLILIIAAFQPGGLHWMYFLLLVPGFGWWFVVQIKGARTDFQQLVANRLLKRADLGQLHTQDD